MCGIVGYVGRRNAVNVLLAGLHRLEYRGYDSAGVALLADGSDRLEVIKTPGKIAALEACVSRALAGRAQLIDAPIGRGHLVSFAIRPFWRWQTQGTYFLGFIAILNWNDLDAGRPEPATRPVGGQ